MAVESVEDRTWPLENEANETEMATVEGALRRRDEAVQQTERLTREEAEELYNLMEEAASTASDNEELKRETKTLEKTKEELTQEFGLRRDLSNYDAAREAAVRNAPNPFSRPKK